MRAAATKVAHQGLCNLVIRCVCIAFKKSSQTHQYTVDTVAALRGLF
jgi:hypothetical protein